MLVISRRLLELTWWQMAFRGIASGFLIAAMVWMIPSAEDAKFWVVTVMTYLIAASGFTHIVAGSMEAYLLVIVRGLAMVADDRTIHGTGAYRQHRGRHRAVCADFLRAGDGGDLGPRPTGWGLLPVPG